MARAKDQRQKKHEFRSKHNHAMRGNKEVLNTRKRKKKIAISPQIPTTRTTKKTDSLRTIDAKQL